MCNGFFLLKGVPPPLGKFSGSAPGYMPEILPIRRKSLSNQSRTPVATHFENVFQSAFHLEPKSTHFDFFFQNAFRVYINITFDEDFK